MMLLNPLNRRVREHDGFPIVPGAFPVIGHVPAVAFDYLGLLRAAERDLGPTFWIDFGLGYRMLICLLPEAFSIYKNKITTSTYLQTLMPELLGCSLLSQDGLSHRHMRGAMNSTFQTPGLVASQVGHMIAGMIDERVRKWRSQGEVRVLAETRELTLAIIFRMLGVAEDTLPLWREKFDRYLMLAVNLPNLPGSPRRRGLRARNWMDREFQRLIDEARARPDTPGLLTRLVHSRDDNGVALSERELLDNLRVVALGGHESSAATIAWTVIKLAQRPDVWDRLCAEVNGVGTVPRSPEELRHFPYAEAVFRETLRLHPTLTTVGRRVLEDFDLGGRRVRAGTDVAMALVHLSRHQDLYENPDDFLPERWLNRAERKITPLEMAQFGGGPHFCLGYHLAWMKLVQFLATLATVMSASGLRPRLAGRFPAPRYLPLQHPPLATRVVFAKGPGG